MTAPAEHRFTRRQFDRMVEAGVFGPEDRLELIDGSVLEMTPQSSRHAAAVQLVQRALQERYERGYSVRVQMPLALGPDSSPEPNIAVVPGGPRDHRDAHPEHAVLVVEVADTSLTLDRGRKRALYARAGIPEYWIVDLVEGAVEVCTGPAGGEYRSCAAHRGGDVVAAGGSWSVEVDELLP